MHQTEAPKKIEIMNSNAEADVQDKQPTSGEDQQKETPGSSDFKSFKDDIEVKQEQEDLEEATSNIDCLS